MTEGVSIAVHRARLFTDVTELSFGQPVYACAVYLSYMSIRVRLQIVSYTKLLHQCTCIISDR